MTLIDDKYDALQRTGGPDLGKPTALETTIASPPGTHRTYVAGSIHHAASAAEAFEVHGAIGSLYAELGAEASPLGYPVTDETDTLSGRGRVNYFEHGAILWSPSSGAHEVHGAIGAAYLVSGAEQSPLGFPVADEAPTTSGGGRVSRFQHGAIYWTPTLGAHEVHGAIGARYAELGADDGALGFPIADEHTTRDGAGRCSAFERGTLYWFPRCGVFAADKCVRVHVKTLVDPLAFDLEGWVAAMRNVYGRIGMLAEIPKVERLALPALATIRIDMSSSTATTHDQEALLRYRAGVGPTDVVAYFVDAMLPSVNGWTVLDGRHAVFVSVKGSLDPYTLAHEVGHQLLGAGHTSDPANLMFVIGFPSSGAVPSLNPAQVTTARASPLITDC